MNNFENDMLKKLKNIEGKRLMEKTRLDYSQNILNILTSNPQVVPVVAEQLELTEEQLFALLSGDKMGNITFYEEALGLVNELTRMPRMRTK